MEEERFPGYAFGRNKGYGTESHRRAIAELGTCPLHRQSFSFHLYSHLSGSAA